MSQPQLPLDPNQPASSELDAQSEEDLRQNGPSGSDRHITVDGNVEGSAVIAGDSNTVVVHNHAQTLSIPRSSTEQKLLNQVKAEVASRLQQSLHNAIFINLIKDAQPTQVARFWDADVKIGSTPPQALPENTTILQAFDRADVAGRLLILGKPGVGKTTTQLELAKALCERCEQQSNYPIPVLFNLSTWKTTTQSIPSWLVAELDSKYGLRRDIGVQWLKEFKLLPLLDGLDELDSQRQLPCIDAINEFISGESAPSYLVIGSRFEEYERLNAPLQLNGAICLRELTDRQIQNYLASANRSVLWNAIAEDESLLEFVRPPLLLSMTVLAYQGKAGLEWQRLQSSQARLNHLLNAYIRRILEQSVPAQAGKKKRKQQKSYSPRQTRLWLTWLAQQMERESQTEFLIERMQPSWLLAEPLYNNYTYTVRSIGEMLFWLSGLGIGLIVGSIWGLGLGLGLGLFWGLFWGLGLQWLFSGLLGGLHWRLVIRAEVITISESIEWSWKGFKRGLGAPRDWLLTVLASLVFLLMPLLRLLTGGSVGSISELVSIGISEQLRWLLIMWSIRLMVAGLIYCVRCKRRGMSCAIVLRACVIEEKPF
ncbi:MAG: NACHT domain-containing protein [Myxacorys chilensis ATA2-1-KO14]|jgi:hypothetical protein|nr:NACHT domain-containing protein [Myxacorys chilensis ATA2-1-KO14]